MFPQRGSFVTVIFWDMIMQQVMDHIVTITNYYNINDLLKDNEIVTPKVIS